MQLDFLINLMYITHFGQNWTYVVYGRPSSDIGVWVVLTKYTEEVVYSIVSRSLPFFCYGGRMEI